MAAAPRISSVAHAPFVLDRVGTYGVRRVHVAKGNPSCRTMEAGAPFCAIFGVVHAHGKRRGRMSAEELVTLLEDLTRFHESAGEWSMQLLDPTFRSELLEEIAGFSIEVDRLEGKFKLSQNRSPEDRERVIEGLRRRGTPADLEILRFMLDGTGANMAGRPSR